MFFSRLFGKNSDANDAVDAFLSVIIKQDMEIDELAKLYSPKLDEIIRKEMANKLSYVGGTFKIDYLNEKSFELSFELFFQDGEKNWVKKESKSKPQPIEYLSKTAVDELNKEKNISFEIDPPKPEEPKQKVRKMPTTES